MTYFEFIDECKRKPEPETEYQWHHIVPLCVGGKNVRENKIKLSYEDHWMAHQLLVDIYPDSKKLKRVAKKSLENFIKACKSQEGNPSGKRGNKGLERSDEHRYKLSINHKSSYDDGNLPMEEKIKRYELKRKKEEVKQLRKDCLEEYEDYIKSAKEKADECYRIKKLLDERIEDLIEMKKHYNNLSRMTFKEYLSEIKRV